MLNKKIMYTIGKLSKSDRLKKSWLFCSETNYLQMDSLLYWVRTSQESTLLNKYTLKLLVANCCLVRKYTIFNSKNKPKNSQYILMKILVLNTHCKNTTIELTSSKATPNTQPSPNNLYINKSTRYFSYKKQQFPLLSSFNTMT